MKDTDIGKTKDSGLTAKLLNVLELPSLEGGKKVQAGSSRALRVALILGLGVLLANCAGQKTSKIDPKYGVSPSPKVVADGSSVPKGGGFAKVGAPYVIAGEVYTPRDMSKYSATGLASWYGSQFHGRMTANGEVFDTSSVTAAHPTMPLPSYIRVTNTLNGRSMIARVNDRGPFHSRRLIDVSERVAEALAFRRQGTARVKVEYIGRAPTEGSDDAILMASLKTDGTPASLRGDARAPVQVASNDQEDAFSASVSRNAENNIDLFTSDNSSQAPGMLSGAANVLSSDEFVAPLPPARKTIARVNLIPAKPVLLGPAASAEPVVKTASIPLPIPRPGGTFYAPVSGFTPSNAFQGLTPQRFVPLN